MNDRNQADDRPNDVRQNLRDGGLHRNPGHVAEHAIRVDFTVGMAVSDLYRYAEQDNQDAQRTEQRLPGKRSLRIQVESLHRYRQLYRKFFTAR